MRTASRTIISGAWAVAWLCGAAAAWWACGAANRAAHADEPPLEAEAADEPQDATSDSGLDSEILGLIAALAPKPPPVDAWLQRLADPDSPAASETLDEILKYRRNDANQPVDETQAADLNRAYLRGLKAKSPDVRRRSILLLRQEGWMMVLIESHARKIVPRVGDDDASVRLAAMQWFRDHRGELENFPELGVLLWANARRLDGADREYAETTVATLGRYLSTNRQVIFCFGRPPPADERWLEYACFVDSPLPAVRAVAFEVLAENSYVVRELYPALLRGLRSGDAAVRNAAVGYAHPWLSEHAHRLSKSSVQELWRLLRGMLEDDPAVSRNSLYHAVGALGPKVRDSAAYLLEGMSDTDEATAGTAAYSLSEVDDGEFMTRSIVRTMLREGAGFRRAAMIYFESIPQEKWPVGPEFEAGLRSLLQDDCAEMRAAAVTLILDGPATALHAEALAEAERIIRDPAFDEDGARKLADSIVSLGVTNDHACRLVRQLLFHRNPDVRDYLLGDMAYMPDDLWRARERYGNDLAFIAGNDRDAEFRTQAAAVLEDWTVRSGEELAEIALP